MAKNYEPRICEHCGKEFIPKRIDSRYCSKECSSHASHKARGSITRLPAKRKCISCGREYDSMQFGKFCSANCKTAHKKSTAKQFTPHDPDGNSNWQAAQEAMQNGDALGYWAMRKAFFIEEDEQLNRTSKNNVAGYDFYEDAFDL